MADTRVEDREVSCMNTLEINGIASINSAKLGVSKSFDNESNTARSERLSGKVGDHYTKNAANDSVVASILSTSINKSFGSSLNVDGKRAVSENDTYNKHELLFRSDLDDVVSNVLTSLKSSAMHIVKHQGNEEALVYFKKQASKGISEGVTLASQELRELSSEGALNKLIQLESALQKGLNEISTIPEDYKYNQVNSPINAVETRLNNVNFANKSGKNIGLTFGAVSFQEQQGTNVDVSRFTTAKNNVSFSVSGDLSIHELKEVADLVNMADSLANKFYYDDINVLYDRALDKGYEKQEIIATAIQLRQKESLAPIRQYDAIKHFNSESSGDDNQAGRKVAEYVSNLYELSDSVEAKFASRSQYKQIINGIVNQMEDVQVPDLLRAINKFHSFNGKFI